MLSSDKQGFDASKMSEVECCDINEGSLNSELRALIISCTEQYAELWDLISKDTIDI